MKSFYQQLCEHIIAGEPVSFSRWGDGEWNAVLGTNKQANCDGHRYFPQMGQRLADILWSNPPYYMGLQNMVQRLRGKELNRWMKTNNVIVDWKDADVFHKASIKGQLPALFSALAHTKIVLVGPEHLKKVSDKYLTPTHFLKIPLKDCWLSYDEILSNISIILKGYDGEMNPVTVLFCAGMPANILIDDLYLKFGHRHSLLDIGSLLDPYAGVHSRTYHKKLTI